MFGTRLPPQPPATQPAHYHDPPSHSLRLLLLPPTSFPDPILPLVPTNSSLPYLLPLPSPPLPPTPPPTPPTPFPTPSPSSSLPYPFSSFPPPLPSHPTPTIKPSQPPPRNPKPSFRPTTKPICPPLPIPTPRPRKSPSFHAKTAISQPHIVCGVRYKMYNIQLKPSPTIPRAKCESQGRAGGICWGYAHTGSAVNSRHKRVEYLGDQFMGLELLGDRVIDIEL